MFTSEHTVLTATQAATGVPGTRIAPSAVVIAGFLARPAPHLPPSGWRRHGSAVLAALTLQVLLALTLLVLRQPAELASRRQTPRAEPNVILPRLVFVAPRVPIESSGGGGGGNRQAGPIRHALGPGPGATTLRTRPPRVESQAPAPAESPLDWSIPAAVALDARSLSGGFGDQIGLPVGGAPTGTSTGPGTGGGVGTGMGTGIGPGVGPGVGSGEGGGSGGGVYRPGGGVTRPILLKRTIPSYTPDALASRIQGTVWLETVVTRDGRPTAIRVLRSLDPGLDDQAVSALREWRFEPGRLAGAPVDVVVSVAMDFFVR